MDLSSLVDETYKKPNQGAAHTNPRDAYKDVPILKRSTWNHEVAAYFFFGGVSAGAALIGSLAEVFGGAEREELAHTAHYISFATLLPCPPLLIADLGRPERFQHMLRIIKPSSPMNLGSWALFTHGAGATVTVLAMLARENRLPLVGGFFHRLPDRLLAAMALPSSFVLAGYTGVLLGTTSIPIWYTSPLLGALFMSSSISTGAAATHIAGLLSGREHADDSRVLSTIGLAAGTTEMALLGGYIVTSGPAAKALLRGELRALLIGAGVGMLLAAALEIGSLRSKRHDPVISAVASAVTLAAGAMLRWAIVRAGRASADDREGTIDAMKPRKGSPGWR